MEKFVFSKHSLEQMVLRDIPEDVVAQILENPGTTIKEKDITIYQSIVIFGQEKYLIRVFVNTEKQPNVVVTVYRTSKIDKYEG